MGIELQPGDYAVVATKGGKWLDRLAGWAIRFGTDSTVNHAFLYVGGGMIVEALMHVQYSPVTDYPDAIWSSGHVDLTEHERQKITDFARSKVGCRYNVLDIIAIALAQRRMGGLVTGREWWVRRLSRDGMYICSQLVDAAYCDAGVNLFPGELAGLVSPGDLLDALDERPVAITA